VHIHSPSEHTVNGKLQDAEIHFVHTAVGGGGYAVVGVFFDVVSGADDNVYLATWINSATNQLKNQANGVTVAMQTKAFFESLADKDFWAYDGSLTTPPCSEGLKWHVIKEVQPMSQAQYDLIKDMGNNRFVQPLNDRTLYATWDSATAISMSAAAVFAGLSTLIY
jgi:carbonic anhydrase